MLLAGVQLFLNRIFFLNSSSQYRNPPKGHNIMPFMGIIREYLVVEDYLVVEQNVRAHYSWKSPKSFGMQDSTRTCFLQKTPS